MSLSLQCKILDTDPWVVEIIGYIGRALAYNQTGELGPYIMQSVLLLLAPVLFAATLYMTLGRVITAVRGEQYSFIPPRWLTRVCTPYIQ